MFSITLTTPINNSWIIKVIRACFNVLHALRCGKIFLAWSLPPKFLKKISLPTVLMLFFFLNFLYILFFIPPLFKGITSSFHSNSNILVNLAFTIYITLIHNITSTVIFPIMALWWPSSVSKATRSMSWFVLPKNNSQADSSISLLEPWIFTYTF